MRNNKENEKGNLLKFTPTCHNNHIHNNITYRKKLKPANNLVTKYPAGK